MRTRIKVSVTADQHAQLERQAAHAGLPLATYVLTLLVQHLAKTQEPK